MMSFSSQTTTAVVILEEVFLFFFLLALLFFCYWICCLALSKSDTQQIENHRLLKLLRRNAGWSTPAPACQTAQPVTMNKDLLKSSASGIHSASSHQPVQPEDTLSAVQPVLLHLHFKKSWSHQLSTTLHLSSVIEEFTDAEPSAPCSVSSCKC